MRISYGKLRVPLQRVVARDDGRHDLLACEVSVEVLGENHTRDPAGEDGSRKVYTDPFPAQGLITLTLERT
jgi:hypothetical protein